MLHASKMAEFVIEGIENRDFSTACRTCLKNDGIVSIFSKITSNTKYTLQERIMSFAYVEICKGDGLPTKICHPCLTQINKAFMFKAQCEYADLFLRKHLSEEEVAEGTDDLVTEERLKEFVGEDLVDELVAKNVIQVSTAENAVREFAVEGVVEVVTGDSSGPSDKTTNTLSMEDCASLSKAPKVVVCTMKEGITHCKSTESGQAGSDICGNSEIMHKIFRTGHRQVASVSNANSSINHVSKTKKANREVSSKSKNSNKEVFFCTLCNKEFNFKGSLVNHLVKEHEQTGEYPCTYCGRTFPQELLLNLHVQSHTAERPHCCNVCGKCFIEESTLKSHEKRHSMAKKYLCIHCGKSYCYKKDHTCRLANPNKERTHPCNICGKKFVRLSTLTTHKKRHRVVDRFRCTTCSKPFFSRQELERHTNVHLGIRPFACDFPECDNTFYSQGELNRHKKYHSGEKKFKCDQCEQTFYESGHLTNHKRKHTGERPYVCEVCSKSFTDSSKLKRHVNTHYDIPRRRSTNKTAGENASRIHPSSTKECIILEGENNYFKLH